MPSLAVSLIFLLPAPKSHHEAAATSFRMPSERDAQPSRRLPKPSMPPSKEHAAGCPPPPLPPPLQLISDSRRHEGFSWVHGTSFGAALRSCISFDGLRWWLQTTTHHTKSTTTNSVLMEGSSRHGVVTPIGYVHCHQPKKVHDEAI